MSLQKHRQDPNRAQKELRSHGTPNFPCAGYSSFYASRSEDCVPWHWHSELELVYVREGSLKLQVPSCAFLLEKGDFAAINSNVLHHASAVRDCQLNSLVFSPSFIFGDSDSVFAKKYILPLISLSSFTGYPVPAASSQDMAEAFQSAFCALSQEPPGFEFLVREKLSRICYSLYLHFQEEISQGAFPFNQDNQRIRRMLEYIHENFAQPLSLGTIAASAHIGERECLRCFKRTIQLSPIQYLMKYRITQGAGLLLENPSASISQISSFCGFDSPSNFTKQFKRFYSCTPKDYRKRDAL